MRWLNVFVSLAGILFFISCEKKENSDTDPVVEVYDSVFVDSTFIVSLDKRLLQFAVSSTPFSQFDSLIQYSVDVYSIVYQTDYKDQKIDVSALICLPKGLKKAGSILSAQHGTLFNHEDAPSNYSTANTSASSNFELLASAGFITILPDYIGFGSSKNILHPYYNENLSAGSVLDGIKALKEFCFKKNIIFNEKLFLLGYSEGGYVTMATLKEITTNQDLEVTAAVAGAGGYNLSEIVDKIVAKNEYPSPNYIGYITYSYIETNDWGINLNQWFNEPYSDRIPVLYDGSNSGSFINSELTQNLGNLLKPGFLSSLRGNSESILTPELKLNSVHDWKSSYPLRLYHGNEDEVVPVEDSEETYTNLLENGSSNVSYHEVEGGTHGTTLEQMIIDVVPWIVTLNK